MSFDNTQNYIESKIKELNLPYFEILVKKEGKEVYSYRYSSSGDNDLLNMYSMSKPITAVAVLQLVEDGKITLQDEVCKYLEGFDNLKLMKNGSKLDEKMTIHHLLTMTSGMDYGFGRPAIVELKKTNPHASTLESVASFVKDGLQFAPGTSYNYSLSVDVAAAIVEKVSGMKFSEYVEKNIFKPLDIKNATFANNKIGFEDTVEEYYADASRSLNKIEGHRQGFLISENYESGGAGLISDVESYSKFMDSLANRENKIINDKSVDLMGYPHVKEPPFSAAIEEYSKNNVEYGYGYAVRVRKVESSNGIPVGEFGWDGAAGSYSSCDRTNNISVVIGLTIFGWPSYVKDLHIQILEHLYKDMGIKE